jgi:hypothetical protein
MKPDPENARSNEDAGDSLESAGHRTGFYFMQHWMLTESLGRVAQMISAGQLYLRRIQAIAGRSIP